jgi:hypothetical protein
LAFDLAGSKAGCENSKACSLISQADKKTFCHLEENR